MKSKNKKVINGRHPNTVAVMFKYREVPKEVKNWAKVHFAITWRNFFSFSLLKNSRGDCFGELKYINKKQQLLQTVVWDINSDGWFEGYISTKREAVTENLTAFVVEE